jgi:hypothetical protein
MPDSTRNQQPHSCPLKGILACGPDLGKSRTPLHSCVSYGRPKGPGASNGLKWTRMHINGATILDGITTARCLSV